MNDDEQRRYDSTINLIGACIEKLVQAHQVLMISAPTALDYKRAADVIEGYESDLSVNNVDRSVSDMVRLIIKYCE